MLFSGSRFFVLLAGLSVCSWVNISPLSGDQAQLPVPGPVVELTPFDPALAEATFDSVWNRVQNTHYDPELGGLDWEAVREELRPRVQAASSILELREILGEMLDRLGESHFAIIPGASAPHSSDR